MPCLDFATGFSSWQVLPPEREDEPKAEMLNRQEAPRPPSPDREENRDQALWQLLAMGLANGQTAEQVAAEALALAGGYRQAALFLLPSRSFPGDADKPRQEGDSAPPRPESDHLPLLLSGYDRQANRFLLVPGPRTLFSREQVEGLTAFLQARHPARSDLDSPAAGNSDWLALPPGDLSPNFLQLPNPFNRGQNGGEASLLPPSAPGLLWIPAREESKHGLLALLWPWSLADSGGEQDRKACASKDGPGRLGLVARWIACHLAEVMEASPGILCSRQQIETQAAALRESHHRVNAILDSAVDGIITIDGEGKIRMVNRAMEYIFGYSAAEMLGRNVAILMSGEEAARHDEHMQRHAETGMGRIVGTGREVTARRKDGSFFPIFLSVSRVKGVRECLYTGMIQDISERKRTETALRDAIRQSRLADRAKMEFLANISHELRTPLNAIIGFSDLMQKQVFGPVENSRYETYVGDIFQSGVHLLGIINDLLDLSDLETRNYELREEEICPEALARAVVQRIKPRASRSRVNLDLQIRDDKALPNIMADRRALKQVLANLLSNAVKFNHMDGTATLTLARTARREICFIVEDSGIGIEEKDLDRILDPFAQADSALNKRYEGAGLGLPLSNALIRQHGGSLDIRSTPGTGTTVTITLPASRVV